MNTLKHMTQKHSGIIILTISLIVIFFLFYWLRNIILPFLLGLIIAFILLPVVRWLEQRLPGRNGDTHTKRIFATLIVLLLAAVLFGTAGYYVVTVSINEIARISNNAPVFFNDAFEIINSWFDSLRDLFPEAISQQMDTLIEETVTNMGTYFQNFSRNIFAMIPDTVSTLMGFATLPVFIFYILKDNKHLSERFYSWLPEKANQHLRHVIAIITNVLGKYIRAQIILAFFIAVISLIGFLIIRTPFAVGLAIITGLANLVPILGPWIGGILAAVVVLATDPSNVIWVIFIILAVQLIENVLLVPKIQGHYLQIHPAIVIVLIVIGTAIAGLWGLILIVPLVSTIMKLYGYVISQARVEDSEPAVNPEVT